MARLPAPKVCAKAVAAALIAGSEVSTAAIAAFWLANRARAKSASELDETADFVDRSCMGRANRDLRKNQFLYHWFIPLVLSVNALYTSCLAAVLKKNCLPRPAGNEIILAG